MASKTLINLSNLQQFLSKLNEKFALKKTMKGISEDSEGNIIIGEEGLVPTPNENSKGKFLRSDGEWALPSETAVYDSMTIEEGVAGVSEVDKVLNAKNLKQIVNSDGFLTSLDSSKLTGIINIENLPQGALERILIVSSKEERLTLLDTEVQLGDVVKESDTGLMYYVINTEKLNSEEGYTQFTAGMASSVSWSGVTNKPLIPTKTSELTNDSGFAIDNNVVHKSGNENISGNKMFSNTIHRYADLTTSGYAQVYRFDDTNANGCGHTFNNVLWVDNCIHDRHGAYNNKSGKTAEIDITLNDSGVGMAYVEGTATKGNLETVTSATGHTGIATMGWVNNPATSTNVVHRSGDENIAGNKLFGDKIICTRFTHYINNSNIYITGGNEWDKGATLVLHGEESIDAGVFIINSRDKTRSLYLVGRPDGTLQWAGQNIALDGNLVHRSGNETIGGAKTFTQDIIFKNNYIDLTVTPSSNTYSNFIFRDKNNKTLGYLQYGKETSGNGNIGIYLYDSNQTLHGLQVTSNNYVIPITNNTYSLGSPNNKWANVYATTFNGNLSGNATSSTKSSYLENYSNPNGNKIYLDWDTQVKGYVGLKVDNTTMGGLITTSNIGSQSVSSASSATYATTQASTDNSTKIATTAWVRTYVDSVAGSSAVGSSISAYYSNATTLTAEGSSSSSGGSYPSDYSDYINISPTVGTIYTGSQLFGTLNASASGSEDSYGISGSTVYHTTAKATATFSGAFSSSAKYLCTTANAVKFRAYVSQGTNSDIGTASVVDNSSAKSIFIRVQ